MKRSGILAFRPDRKVVLCILGACFLAFGLSIGNNFVDWDDAGLIVQNPLINEVSIRSLWFIFTTFEPELYAPLTQLSFLITRLLGTDPFLFHLTSLVLHMMNAILVVWFLSAIGKKKTIGIIGGLLFAIHPLHTEAVAWASARKELLATLFYLSTLLSYLSYREKKDISKYKRTVLLCLIGFLCKVTLVTLPLALLLVDWIRKRKLSRVLLAEKIPFFMLSLLFGFIALVGKQATIADTPVYEKVLLACKSMVFHIERLFVPIKLSIIHPWTKDVSLLTAPIAFSVCVTVTLIALCCILRKKHPLFTFGYAFFLLSMSPMLINNNLSEGQILLTYDRYAYLPSIGFFLVIGWLLHSALLRWKKRTTLIYSAIGIEIAALIVLSMFQTSTWKDTGTVFTNVLKWYPNSYVAQYSLGNFYMSRGEINRGNPKQPQKALAAFAKATELNPKSPVVHVNAGAVYGELGEKKKELSAYQTAVELDPDFIVARYNLGRAYEDAGESELAAEQYREILKRTEKFLDSEKRLKKLKWNASN